MSFVSAILERCRGKGSRPVLYEVHGKELLGESGRDLCDAVARARGFLRTRGLQAGDRVALLGPNSAAWVALDLAILAEGCISVPLYSRQDTRELAGMLRDCEPGLLLADGEPLASAIGAVWQPGRVALYADAFAAGAVAEDARAITADDPVTIVYTSGTSGEPKGAMLSERNVDYMLGVTVHELSAMSGADREEDRVFHYLPFCFAGSRIMLWSQLRRGNPLMMGTDLTNLQQELQTSAPHYCLNVPALLERIRNGVIQRLRGMGGPVWELYVRAATVHASGAEPGPSLDRAALWLARRVLFPRIKKLIGPNLEFLACGSAMLSEETQRWFEMIGIPVYQVYGLTESTAIITIDDTERVLPGRVGRAITGCELRVTDEGELLCRGPNVFLGYWNRPEATAAVLRDGWLHTGDQAEVDAGGNVKIAGRIKELLVPESGHNVAPASIEQRLLAASDRIEQAVVLGHGRPYLTALISGKVDESELDLIRDRVNAQVPHYMRLRRLYRTPEPFTAENGLLTANQKLKRRAIEEHYRQAIEQMYQ